MTTIGTAHFTDRRSANRYYVGYGLTAKDVDEKFKNGEIFLGQPELKEGQRLSVNSEGRYIITY